MSAVSVKLKNVTKTFQENKKKIIAVDNFSFDFPPGKLTTLLGPSGCGKTTTLRCIAGFCEPEEGEIYIGNERVNGIPPYNRPTGTVFQNYALFPHMTVFENIAYGLRVKKLPQKIIRKKVEWGLELLRLNGMEDRSPGQLSGGQQQRVAIARVLVNEPKVLLFDEPLSNLDAKLRVYMRGEIKAIQEKLGITTIYVTHDQEEAMSISDVLLVMNNGKIQQIGNPIEIYRYPQNEFVASFIGLINILDGKVINKESNYLKMSVFEREFTIPKNESLEVGDEINILIRPEAFKLSTEKKLNSFQGKVIKYFFLGSLIRYEIKLEDNKIVTVDNPNPKTIHEKGNIVWLEIDLDSIHLKKKS